MESKVIVLDFDGTVVSHEFPEVGHDLGCVPVLRALVDSGHSLVLSTVRSDLADVPETVDPSMVKQSGSFLSDAVAWFMERKIPLYGVQKNPDQEAWTSSPKPYGDLYIDDCALGSPVVRPPDGSRPYVHWGQALEMLYLLGYLSPEKYHETYFAMRKEGLSCRK